MWSIYSLQGLVCNTTPTFQMGTSPLVLRAWTLGSHRYQNETETIKPSPNIQTIKALDHARWAAGG